ncbi:MAG TPA: GNAT family N-acetyltransferase [Actinocrinis sp.]|nr:GNAT family N-acetyltransferase [Actinocrinis sp.]
MSIIAGKRPDGDGEGPAPGGVVLADPADAAHLSVIVAAAFVSLAPSAWLIPDEPTRREIFPEYFRLYVDEAFASGTVYTNSDRTAVALWITKPQQQNFAGRGAQPPRLTANPAHAQDSEYDERLGAVTGPWAYRFREFDAALDRHHPTGPAHHHLAILAVHPDVQHAGIGSALLAEHHRVLDAAGIPAYLEASDTRTRALYLRVGYQDRGDPIQLPAKGPLMYPMVRRPVARVQ